MEQRIEDGLSPYRVFTRKEWAARREDTPMTLTRGEIAELQAFNDRLSMKEVEEIYLPLSRLLSFYVGSMQKLFRAMRRFLGTEDAKTPYIIGIGGSVAVGKSTTARVLQALLSRWPNTPKVDLITTDGFLLPNAVLEREGLMQKKGFPESYDTETLLRFLTEIKAGHRPVRAPVYSHLVYDVIPGESVEVDRPDILIVEGLNVLQPNRAAKESKETPFVSDFFDFSVYIDADENILERWYVERFMRLRETAFRDPKSYFHRYAAVSEKEAHDTAHLAMEPHQSREPARKYSADAAAREPDLAKRRGSRDRDRRAAQALTGSRRENGCLRPPEYSWPVLRPPRAAAIASSSRSRSKGLTINPSMPAARHASRSSAKAFAVSAIMGTPPASVPSARIRFVASRPSMPGRCRSIRTRS